MVNAWSLLYDVLNGTLDKEYPIVNKKEIDEIDNTLSLMLDIMVLTNFYRQKFFTIEKLRLEREILLSKLKVSSLLLLNKNDNFQNIIDIGMNTALIDVDSFNKEIQEHL